MNEKVGKDLIMSVSSDEITESSNFSGFDSEASRVNYWKDINTNIQYDGNFGIDFQKSSKNHQAGGN